MTLARLSTPILVVLMAAPFAATAEPVSTDEVYACASMDDDAERLACYDAAVGRLKQAEEAGEITTVTREQVAEVQRDSFGFSIPSLPSIAMPRLGGGEAEEIEELTFAVTDLDRSGYGKVTVTLENGQVWRQTDSERTPLSADEALIKRAAFGSYMMKLDGGRAFRVERVR